MFRIGIAGCGYWGSNLIRAALKLENVKVEAICDPDAGARQRAASLLAGDVKTHSAFEYLLSDRIDGVVIASPPALHVEQAVCSLNRGKAVFVEKPPALTLPDLKRLLDAASGKTLVCDYVYLFNSLVNWAHDYVKNTGFELVHAQANWLNKGIVRKDVSAWWSAAPHGISVLVHLFGDAKLKNCVHGVPPIGEQSPYSVGILEIANALATVFVSWAHPTKTRRIELVGKSDSLVIDDVEKKVWVIDHESGISSPSVEYVEPLVSALNNFVNCAKMGAESVAGPEMIEKVTRTMISV